MKLDKSKIIFIFLLILIFFTTVLIGLILYDTGITHLSTFSFSPLLLISFISLLLISLFIFLFIPKDSQLADWKKGFLYGFFASLISFFIFGILKGILFFPFLLIFGVIAVMFVNSMVKRKWLLSTVFLFVQLIIADFLYFLKGIPAEFSAGGVITLNITSNLIENYLFYLLPLFLISCALLEISLKNLKEQKKAMISIAVSILIIILYISMAFIYVSLPTPLSEKEYVLSEIKANLNERLVIGGYDFEIKVNKTREIYFGIKNNLNKNYTFAIMGSGTVSKNGTWNKDGSFIGCYAAQNLDIKENDIKKYINIETFKSRKIEKAKTNVLKFIVQVSASAEPSTYKCAIIIEDPSNPGNIYARKKFFITVPR